MISSRNEHVMIGDLSDITLQIIFDAWRASMNVGSKYPIGWNDYRHATSWWFYLHCRIAETGSHGIICILCHQVLRHASEHGTSSKGKHWLAKTHIAKLNKLTESENTSLTSSMVDGTAWANLRRQGSRGTTIESSQRKFTLDVQVRSISTEMTDTALETNNNGLWNFRISPRHMELRPDVKIYFGSYTMESYIKSRACKVL